MNSKYVGGVLFIVGTSIGAGMLALPVANASLGFWPSTGLLFFCWFLMFCGALYMLEASFYVPKGGHLLAMSHVTLGRSGILLTWVTYLLLLYSLLSAFISGGSDVLGGVIQKTRLSMPAGFSVSLFTLIFGLFVYQGIYVVDWINRLLMFAKLAVYVGLIGLTLPHAHTELLAIKPGIFQPAMLMILITSFGFAIIVPNLRDYFDRDKLSLRKVIAIGSIIPLVCYILWDAMILGVIPALGKDGLMMLQTSPHATSDLAFKIATLTDSVLISWLFYFFTAICMLTAFLGVGLSLMSFLADALKLEQSGRPGIILYILTFFPPWLIVMFYPGAYLYALSYAGDFCVILLLFLPALMTYKGRQLYPDAWRVPGGRFLQVFVMLSALFLLIMSFVSV